MCDADDKMVITRIETNLVLNKKGKGIVGLEILHLSCS